MYGIVYILHCNKMIHINRECIRLYNNVLNNIVSLCNNFILWHCVLLYSIDKTFTKNM